MAPTGSRDFHGCVTEPAYSRPIDHSGAELSCCGHDTASATVDAGGATPGRDAHKTRPNQQF
jgi:hypothetical protein